MEAHLPAAALKPFAKILQCMHKIGEDLYVSAKSSKLNLATVNAARSAFVLFSLHRGFFDYYTTASLDPANAKLFSCHILLKPLLNIFRGKNHLDNIERCKLELKGSSDQDRLVIQLHCRHGVVKTHKLHYEECDALSAIYTKHTCRNKWTISSKITSDWLVHFHHRLEEVTMACGSDYITFSSFTESVIGEEADLLANRAMQTELEVDPRDFDVYDIKDETRITFNLKEFKAALSFADGMGQPLSAFFDGPGSPIILAVTHPPDLYNVDFVLASMRDPHQPLSQTPAQSQPHPSKRVSSQQPMPASIPPPTPHHLTPQTHAIEADDDEALLFDQTDLADDIDLDQVDHLSQSFVAKHQTQTPTQQQNQHAMSHYGEEELPPSPPHHLPGVRALVQQLDEVRRRGEAYRRLDDELQRQKRSQMPLSSDEEETISHVSESLPTARPDLGPARTIPQSTVSRARVDVQDALGFMDEEVIGPTPGARRTGEMFESQ
ncbi:Rad9-domain-containing protein [Gaertneriomyces semiglobifer]|nr:Rad9-domain-containing protein [Gaertneriomyces semiglobifer]